VSDDAAARGDEQPDAPEGDQDAEDSATLLDVIVYGPIDAAFSLLRDPRGAAVRGRARVDQALRQARALGELSVRFGQRELKRRTEGADEDDDAAADAAAAARRAAAGPAPDEVIAGYDTLSASQIVPMLQGLDPDERSRVAAYERETRARQTILRRIAQLDAPGA
jgi:hypothetical protein